MPIRDASRVSGSLMDFTRLSELPADDCEVLLVSSRTLYMLANYAVNEANYLARYYLEEFDGNLVRVAEESDPEVPTIREIAQAFRQEVIPVTCDLVSELRAIASAITSLQLAGCCPPTGTYPPQPTTTEGQPPPEGFREYDTLIDDRKCKLANMAIDDLIAVINLLIVNDVDDIASLGVGAMSALWALVVAAIPAGPVALALGALGAVVSLVGFFIVNTLDLAGLITIIEDNREDLVCAIYNSPDNVSAYDAIYSILDDAGFGAVDLLFLDTLHLLDGLTAIFFAPDDATGDEIEARLDGYVATTDCSVCPIPVSHWRFMLADEHNIFTNSADGEIGTGVILNDGNSFTLTSELIDWSGGTNNTYAIAIIVEGFALAPGMVPTYPLGIDTTLFGGQYEFVSGTNMVNMSVFGRGDDGSDCTNRSVTTLLSPGTVNGALALYWAHNVANGPFTVTLRINSLPTVCP